MNILKVFSIWVEFKVKGNILTRMWKDNLYCIGNCKFDCILCKTIVEFICKIKFLLIFWPPINASCLHETAFFVVKLENWFLSANFQVKNICCSKTFIEVLLNKSFLRKFRPYESPPWSIFSCWNSKFISQRFVLASKCEATSF